MMKRFCCCTVLLIFGLSVFAQHWDSLPAYPNIPARVFYTDTVSNKLYIGGTFTRIGNDTIWGIASWDGSRWDSLGHGMDDPSIGSPNNTYAIVRFANYLYAGGAFRLAGNNNIPGLARWDGNDWDTVPGAALSVYDVVTDLISYNSELFISGSFDTIGNLPVGGIARWDGINSQPIGNYNFLANGGLIWRMKFYRGNLYVSGAFDDPNGNSCRLARWDGLNWHFFTSEIIIAIGGVEDIEVYQDKLYVSGCFFSSDGNAGTAIMNWNDTLWSAVGGSVQVGSINPYPFVRQICVHNGKLYCIGSFEYAGGISAKGLASWDGTQWCSYDAVFTSASNLFCGASNMEFYKDTLYAGGVFQKLDSLPIIHIAKWTGGNFIDSCGFISTGIYETSDENQFNLYPNPSNGHFEIQGTFPVNTYLEIFNMLGQRVWLIKINPGETKQEINLPLAAGVYGYRVNADGEIFKSGKLVIEK